MIRFESNFRNHNLCNLVVSTHTSDVIHHIVASTLSLFAVLVTCTNVLLSYKMVIAVHHSRQHLDLQNMITEKNIKHKSVPLLSTLVKIGAPHVFTWFPVCLVNIMILNGVSLDPVVTSWLVMVCGQICNISNPLVYSLLSCIKERRTPSGPK